MDIKTDTPLVKKAREGVMEFLLVGFYMVFLCLACCAHMRYENYHAIAHLNLNRVYVHATVLCRSTILWIVQFAIKEASVICKIRQCSMAVTGGASSR